MIFYYMFKYQNYKNTIPTFNQSESFNTYYNIINMLIKMKGC